MSVESTVKNIFIKTVGVNEPITRDTRLVEDLEADSIDYFEISLELEEKFDDIDIIEEHFEKLKTVGQIIDYVEGQLEE